MHTKQFSFHIFHKVINYFKNYKKWVKFLNVSLFTRFDLKCMINLSLSSFAWIYSFYLMCKSRQIVEMILWMIMIQNTHSMCLIKAVHTLKMRRCCQLCISLVAWWSWSDVLQGKSHINKNVDADDDGSDKKKMRDVICEWKYHNEYAMRLRW